MDAGRAQWCTECGAEHRLGAHDCAFCGGSLAAQPPEPVPPVQVDHALGHLDVSDLGRQQRDALALLLRAEDIPHVFERHLLRVPEAQVATAEAMLADVLEPLDPTSEAATAFEEEAIVASHEHGDETLASIAGTTRRVVARVLAWFVLSLAGSFAMWFWLYVNPNSGAVFIPFTEVLILTELVLVARFGSDLGKLAGGMRLVGEDGSLPGWRRASIRTVVMWGPVLVSDWSSWALTFVSDAGALTMSLVAIAWTVALIVSIATHPERRGWHDRAAGTWVIDVRDPGVPTRSVRRMTTFR